MSRSRFNASSRCFTGEVWPFVFLSVFAGGGYSIECGDYDPRVRPWYVAASSGPKDVVIIMDISGSMVDEGRLALAQDAVASVLGTINEHTYVNIVLFSTSMCVCLG